MTKRRTRSSRRRPAPSRPAPEPTPAAPKSGRAAPLLAVGLLVVGAGVFLFAAVGDDTTSATPVAAASAPQAAAKPFPYHDSPEAARPFPVTKSPSAYTHETLQTAYAIAKEIPEVLVQLPCLCGCHGVQEDHGSLLDCFVDDHAAT